MVKIRLRRKGKKFYPVYDIVVMHSRNRRDGAFIERLGYYDPNTTRSTIKIDHNRAIYWINNGAQPTNIARHLLSYDGVLLRRFLQEKSKDVEEINNEVEKHREVVAARYERRKKLRSQRIIRKAKEAEEAKRKSEAKSAEDVANAETPAE
jgi:small subunit ribosomal protein S16